MSKAKFIWPSIFLLISFSLRAQSTPPVFSWSSHFSYNHVGDIALGDNKVFAAAQNGLFYIDLEDNSINLLNKVNGLSFTNISAIHYDNGSEKLVVAYQNGAIDFWSNSTISTFNEILNSDLNISKSFEDITSNDQQLFLFGELGIVVMNSESETLNEAYTNIGRNGDQVRVNDISFKGDSIYAASEDGILSATNDGSENLLDFRSWNREFVGIEFEQIVFVGNTGYASSQNDLFQKTEDSWEFLNSFPSPIHTLLEDQGRLIIGTEESILTFDSSFEVIFQNSGRSNTLAISDNTYWLGMQQKGIVQRSLTSHNGIEWKPPGPGSAILTEIESNASGISALNNKSFNVFNRNDRTWNAYNFERSGTQIEDLQASSEIEDGNYIIASNRFGLLDIDANLLLPNTNPTLASLNNSFGIEDIKYRNEELWITTPSRTESLHAWNLERDEWQAFDLNHSTGESIRDIFIANNGDKWLTVDPDQGGGILVFNETNNRIRHLTTNGGDGGITGREVTDMVYDQNEFLWVTTNAGVSFFTNPDDILNGSPITSEVPIFENRVLLRNEFITAMAVDPANRKWFGTRENGLWLFSETGDELIFHFTEDNSPLPSGAILDLAIIPETGELFIATENGTVSFRSDAALGERVHSNVKIYPNPVLPNFTGNVIIEGLVDNAEVKITNAAGLLVTNLRSNGSIATWNLRDINNSVISTGVYLVFSSNFSGDETYVGKIIIGR